MTTRHLLLSAIMFVQLAHVSVYGQTDLTARLDAIVEAPIKAGTVAGVSVAVVKGGATVLMKGYGLADLELNVPTPPGATYEIGSVTKQFTSRVAPPFTTATDAPATVPALMGASTMASMRAVRSACP